MSSSPCPHGCRPGHPAPRGRTASRRFAPITADDYGGIACARAHAAGALGRKRQADRRADEVGLLRNEWGSLLPAVRGRLLMIATNEGFRAAAMLAHRARLSTSAAVKLVSEVNGTKSGARQAAMVKNIEATVYIDRIRELAGGICPVGPVGGVGRSRVWGWRWGHWEHCQRT